MGCVLLLPAGLSLQNPRTIDPFNGMGYLVYSKAQQYGGHFYSAFLMPTPPTLRICSREGILKQHDGLPVVGIARRAGVLRAAQPPVHHLKVCVVCAFVPILNSLFYALNCSSYYARWYYMPVLVLVRYGVHCWRPHLARQGLLARAWGLTLAVTLSTAAFGLVPLPTMTA